MRNKGTLTNCFRVTNWTLVFNWRKSIIHPKQIQAHQVIKFLLTQTSLLLIPQYQDFILGEIPPLGHGKLPDQWLHLDVQQCFPEIKTCQKLFLSGLYKLCAKSFDVTAAAETCYQTWPASLERLLLISNPIPPGTMWCTRKSRSRASRQCSRVTFSSLARSEVYPTPGPFYWIIVCYV